MGIPPINYNPFHIPCRGLIIKNVTLDDGGSYKCKATQSGFGITDFRDLVIHLKIERELNKKSFTWVLQIGSTSGTFNEGLFDAA